MLRWLVIGIGDITTRRVLPAILAEPRSRLAGIVTRDPEKARKWEVPGWTDLAQGIAESGCDAVYVASPVFLHAPQTIGALRAGRHVLCEKPVAMNYAEARTMQSTAQEMKRTFGIAYYRRMYPAINRAKEMIGLGAIGKPVFAEATAHDWFHPLDGFRGWLLDPAKAGAGPLFDIASHRIDLMNYFFGDPVSVTGQTSKAVHQAAVEDNASVLIEYPEGVRAFIDVRWHSRIPRDEFRIRGTEGELELTPLHSGTLKHPGGIEDLPPHANLHYPCIENFVSAVLEGIEPRASGASSIITDRVTEQVPRQ